MLIALLRLHYYKKCDKFNSYFSHVFRTNSRKIRLIIINNLLTDIGIFPLNKFKGVSQTFITKDPLSQFHIIIKILFQNPSREEGLVPERSCPDKQRSDSGRSDSGRSIVGNGI